MTGQSGNVIDLLSCSNIEFVCIVMLIKYTGSWYYQLVCLLANGLPFLLHYSVNKADDTTKLTKPVISVIKRWFQMVENQYEATRQSNILVFDSFYMDSTIKELAL